MSAALGGVIAAGVGLPETLGYIVGGMVVGPSGVDVIRMVRRRKVVGTRGCDLDCLGSVSVGFGSRVRVEGAREERWACPPVACRR